MSRTGHGPSAQLIQRLSSRPLQLNESNDIQRQQKQVQRLGTVKCGQRMTFSNLRAINLVIVVRHIMGESFLRTSTTQRCSTERVLSCWSRLSQRPVIDAVCHTNLRRCRCSVPNYWCIHDHDHACGKPPRQRAIAQGFSAWHEPEVPKSTADFRLSR
jgi:hypothetical protein